MISNARDVHHLQIILLASGESDKLLPLTSLIPSPMLPVVNRPIMAYTIELLARQGFKNIWISLYHLAGSIETYFRSGAQWGINLHYVIQRDALGSAGSLWWASSALTSTFLVMPTDILLEIDVASVLDYHRSQKSTATIVYHPAMEIIPDTPHEGYSDSTTLRGDKNDLHQTGMYIFEPEVLSFIPPRTMFDIETQLLPAVIESGGKVSHVLAKGYWNSLKTFQHYKIAQQTFVQYSPTELKEPENESSLQAYLEWKGREISNGIWIGKDTKIHPSALLIPPVHTGEKCFIGQNVKLGPFVVLGTNVIIDKGAALSYATILDNTFIGPNIKIHHAFIYKELIVDLEKKKSATVLDPLFVGDAQLGAIYPDVIRVFDALLGSLFLLLIFPLLFLMGIVLWITTGKVFVSTPCISTDPFQKKQNPSNKSQTINLLRFNIRKSDGSAPLFNRLIERIELHHLPELWNVIRGEVSLVGISPLEKALREKIDEQWLHIREGNRIGITGLWFVQNKQKCDLDELMVADAYYLATHSWRQDLRLLWETPGAWLRRITYRNKIESSPRGGENELGNGST